MKKCVILGAGQTGRGFIAPMIQKSGGELIFIDKDKNLVTELNAKESYTIRYYMNVAPSVTIDGYKAYHTDSKQAKVFLSQSDLIFIAVGGQNIKNLVPLLKAAGIKKGVKIILCENGINVKQPLLEAGFNAIISESIIFCTTLKDEKLDLRCEVYPNIPYDASVEGIGELEICGFQGVQDFPSLIQRKIYTYNCLSACIAYLGAYKGYTIYADAAHDAEISIVMNNLMEHINLAIAKEYRIRPKEQSSFASLAFAKFKNTEIVDTIERNTRDVHRKLSANERMIAPLRICIRHGEDTSFLELVIASALYNGELCISAFKEISEIGDLPQCLARIEELLKKLRAGKSLTDICSEMIGT